jgi:hypothetical protein
LSDSVVLSAFLCAKLAIFVGYTSLHWHYPPLHLHYTFADVFAECGNTKSTLNKRFCPRTAFQILIIPTAKLVSAPPELGSALDAQHVFIRLKAAA